MDITITGHVNVNADKVAITVDEDCRMELEVAQKELIIQLPREGQMLATRAYDKYNHILSATVNKKMIIVKQAVMNELRQIEDEICIFDDIVGFRIKCEIRLVRYQFIEKSRNKRLICGVKATLISAYKF